MSSRDRKILSTLALLLVLVAAGSYFWLTRPPTSMELLAALPPGSTALAGGTWSTQRGRAPSQLGPQDSFRLGVRSVELRLATERGEAAKAVEICQEIRRSLDPAMAPDVLALLAWIEAAKAKEQASQIELLDSLLADSPFFLEVTDYRFGQWARTATEVLASGNPALVPSLADQRTFPALQDEALVKQRAIQIRLLAGEPAAALADLRELIETSGQATPR